jgi:hypothetical protein
MGGGVDHGLPSRLPESPDAPGAPGLFMEEVAMKKFSTTVLLVAVMFVAMSVASVILVAVTATPAEAAPGCTCPLTYSPVICSNGKTYPNLCVAKCHHASGCVPIPVF